MTEADTCREFVTPKPVEAGWGAVESVKVESFFLEDVALWLDDADVRYTPRVNFVGHSRYKLQFDFVVPRSKRAPERILRAINNPNTDYAQSAAFAWVDGKDVRPADSLAFAIQGAPRRVMAL